MTQGEYPYPADEFDGVDRSAGPRGSHRRPRSAWARYWPYVLVLAVSAVLAFALVGYVWDEREPAPSAQGPGAATATDAAAEGTADPGATPSASPQGEPDLAAPVSVVNATSVQGLAGEVAERLRDAGWTEVTTGNYAGEDLAASAVRYATPDLEASARAVADELGITTVELAGADGAADATAADEVATEEDAEDDAAADDDAATQGIEVVLEADFDA